MSDQVPVPSLIVAIIILLVIAPFGLTAAFFVAYRVARKPRKFARYFVEVHTAFQGIIVGVILVPMQLTIYLVHFVNFPLPYGLGLAQTLTMRISQGVMVVNVAAITVKRARTMTHGSRSSSNVIEIGPVILGWVIGLSLGIGATVQTAGDNFNFHNTTESEFGYQNSYSTNEYASYSKHDYFDAVYLGLLLVTSVIMLGAFISVRNHIQSAIGGATPVGVYRICGLERGLSENVALQFVTANGRKTTVIREHSQGTLSSSVFVDNWVSEKSPRKISVHRTILSGPTLSNLSPNSKVVRSRDEESGIFQSIKSGFSEHSLRSSKKTGFDVIQEDCELEDAISNLSEEELHETLDVDFLRTASSQTNNSWEMEYSNSLSQRRSYGFVSPDNSSHDHTSNSRCSIYSFGSNHRLNLPASSDQEHTSSMSSRMNIGSPSSGIRSGRKRLCSTTDCSNTSLPPLKHAWQSPSCLSLKQNVLSTDIFSLGSKSSIETEMPSSLAPFEELLSLRVTALAEVCANSTDQPSTGIDNRESADSVDATDGNGEGIPTSHLDYESQCMGEKSNSCLDKVRKDQLNELNKCSYNDKRQRQVKGITEEPKSVKPVDPVSAEIRVTRPSIQANALLLRKNGIVQDGVILRVESEQGKVEPVLETIPPGNETCDEKAARAPRKMSKTVNPSVLPVRRYSTGSTNPSRRVGRCSIQGPLSVHRLNNTRYKEIVIRRFILAFLVNIVTQIPYTALQLLKPKYQAYMIVQPILLSIAVISFALNPYIYVLGNKVIHKLLVKS